MDRSLHHIARPPVSLTSDHALRRQRGWVVHLALLGCDQVLIFFSFALAYWMRYHADWPPVLEPIFSQVDSQNLVSFNAFLPVTIMLVVTMSIVFETRRLYHLPRAAGLLDHARVLVSGTLTAVAFLIVVVFLYRPFYYSRLIIPLAGFNSVVILLLWRTLLLTVRRWAWQHGIGQDRVLVVGGNGLGKQVMDGISAHPGLGYSLVGYMHDDPQASQAEKGDYHYLGTLDNLQRVIETRDIHQVILALPFWEHRRLPHLVQQCRSLGVEFRIAPDLYEISFDRVEVLHISGVPLIGLKELNIRGWNLALKRVLEVLLVLLLSPLLLPIMAAIALLVKFDSPGPVLFRQTRVGKDGHHFTCFKFRTMVADAEKRKAELVTLNEADGPLFKIRRDPRVTRVGRVLRRSSLDELPQLWNVLRGEMSLVGPRPALPEEVAQYNTTHRRRLEVTPGLTGLWQVLGRCETTFDEMVRLDIYYAENWSLWLDFVILLKTLPVVLMGRGAY